MPKCLLLIVLLIANAAHAAAPATFEDAKRASREQVYHDQNQRATPGELYCGCRWTWVGRSSGRVDFASCGYSVRAEANRAARIEWEHIVPAYAFGSQRRCWQNGGRKHCNATDLVFSAMEADLHNLAPSVGEVNADRSNYRYGVLPPQTVKQYGACETKVDFRGRVAEPRDAVKGMVARVQFYMHDRYDLTMSAQQQRLFMAWDKRFPVSEGERERDRRVAAVMGHSNPFVTGRRQWSLGHQNSREGIVAPVPEGHPARHPPVSAQRAESLPSTGTAIRGNRRSKVYHLPLGCPGYDQVAAKNQVRFKTEAEAQVAGFRKAGNCQ